MPVDSLILARKVLYRALFVFAAFTMVASIVLIVQTVVQCENYYRLFNS